MTVKFRFAPSPTGKIHIGNIRTAIITWLAARSMGGQVVLRIDDTDLERSRDEYTELIKQDLTWLGFEWDEYVHQRDRTDRYNAVIQRLKADGRLYPCYETSEQLDLKRKSLLNRGLPPIYDRDSLKLTDEEKAAFESRGIKPHWRFKLDHTPIIWDDLVRGSVKFDGSLMSDPVLIREDGSPLYHLCSVIDDIDFKITHITRGEDHVSNTATHIQMFEALGAKPPLFAHLPLLADAEGGKLSKRLGSLAIESLRNDEGIEPMAIISLLARLGTSEPIEAFSNIQPLVDTFDFSKFSSGAPKVDPAEMERLNARIVHNMDYFDVKGRPELVGVDETFWNAVKPNLNKIRDIKDWVNIAQDNVATTIADEDKDYIRLAAKILPEGEFDEMTWGNWLKLIKAQTDRKGCALFMPLRQALTGMDHGPELDKILPLIGRERALHRLQQSAYS